MKFAIEHEREDNGRWLPEVPELSGILAYGTSADEAMAKAVVLALRVLAERLEHDQTGPQPISIAIVAACARGLCRRHDVFLGRTSPKC